jgi:hypothetical protein
LCWVDEVKLDEKEKESTVEIFAVGWVLMVRGSVFKDGGWEGALIAKGLLGRESDFVKEEEWESR